MKLAKEYILLININGGDDMKLSGRQKYIMKSLLESHDYQTTEQIAKQLNVSKKTIYRELNELRILLKDYQIAIDSKIGAGVRMDIDQHTRNRLTLDFATDSHIPMDQRRYEILIDLLQRAPQMTSIQKLSDSYFVSRSSIQNDLKFIEEWIRTYNLDLIRNTQGTGIDGDEINIRKALTNAIIKFHTGNTVLNHIRDNDRIDSDTRSILFHQFSEKVVIYVENLIHEAETQLQSVIGDPYYINILTHILILINRVRSGKQLDNIHIGINEVDLHVFRIAVEISTKIKLHMNLEIPDSEIYYIYQHLDTTGYGSEPSHTNSEIVFANINSQVKDYCNDIIQAMSEITDSSIVYDNYLKRYLLLHLHSMIGRQKYQIEISCPLLEAVKNDYKDLFDKTVTIVNEITHRHYPQYHISKDELAYLTLYIQGSLEVVQLKKLRVIVVCSSGIGTSHLLMARIQKTFPDWEIIDMIAASKINTLPLVSGKIDLIVSTVNITNYQLNIPLAFVSVLFNENDIKNVKSVLENR